MCLPHEQGGLYLQRETIDPAAPVLIFVALACVVSRRGVNFSLISNTEGNQDDCCKWQWDEINEDSLFPCIWVGVLSNLISLFCLFLREPRMLMHLVLEILPWLQSWILYCCMVVALNEHQVPVCCSQQFFVSLLCYLAQQQVASDSRYCALRFSPTHLCLYSEACSQLFMIKHCSNSQVKIYWHRGGWEEGVAGWSSVSTWSW